MSISSRNSYTSTISNRNAVRASSHPRCCCSQCRLAQLSNYIRAKTRCAWSPDRVIPGRLFYHRKCRLGGGGGGELAFSAVAGDPDPHSHFEVAQRKTFAT